MSELTNALWIETRKALRSRVPLFTALGFLIAPLACALAMVIYKDPQAARELGLIGAKANLVGGSADWPFYLNMLAQAVAIGGLLLFSLVQTWIFGREFADGTVKDLLAVPVGRSALVSAKFIVAAVWSAGLVVLIYLIGLALGALITLPQGSPAVLAAGSRTLAVTTLLVIVAVTPIGLLASVGRGYLLPMGLAILGVALANLLAFLGWGHLFPWSAPALYAGVAGAAAAFDPRGYWIVLLTGAAGVIAADRWWRTADQAR
jgi:ABC-2 type transport system permease protein